MQEHPKESCFRWPSFKHCKLVIKLNATDCDVPVTTFLTHPFNTPLLAGLSLLLLEFSRPKNIADYDVFARTWRRMSQFFVRLVWFLSSGCSCASETSGKFGPRRLPISSGGGLYVNESIAQNNGTMVFSNCSSKRNGVESQILWTVGTFGPKRDSKRIDPIRRPITFDRKKKFHYCVILDFGIAQNFIC